MHRLHSKPSLCLFVRAKRLLLSLALPLAQMSQT